MAFSTSFNTAATGLNAAKTRMSTVSNNVTNADNEAYNRQRVETSFRQDNMMQGIKVGSGVEVEHVQRLVDDFLTKSEVDQSGRLGGTKTRAELADRLDTIFADSEKGGVASALENFFNSVADLSNRPSGEAERSQMLSSGRELAHLLAQKDERLQNLQKEVDTRMDDTVKEINSLASRIADLNERILASESATPGEAKGLRDQRGEALKELADKVGINYYEDKQGAVQVKLKGGGYSLVHSEDANQLARKGKTEAGFAGITLQGQTEVDITHKIEGGSLSAQVRMRDETVTQLRDRLDRLAYRLTAEVNKVHSQGTGLSYNKELTASYRAADTSAAVNNQEKSKLAFGKLFQAGDLTFAIHNTSTNDVQMRSVAFQGDESLQEVQKKLDGVKGLTAELESGRLRLATSDDNHDFAIKSAQDGFSATQSGARVGDVDASLGGQLSGFQGQKGTLSFQLTAPDGTTHLDSVEVGAGDSLRELADKINKQVGHVQANITDEGRLDLRSTEDYQFAYAKDTANVLGALDMDRGASHLFAAVGMQNFFGVEGGQQVAAGTASAASNLQLDEYVDGHGGRVAAGQLQARQDTAGDVQTDADGDQVYELSVSENSNALDLRGIQSQRYGIDPGPPTTLMEHYSGTVAEAGDEKASADNLKEHQQRVMDQIQQERAEKSGVNIDEEMTKMLQFQRAYQASSKVITTADEMFGSLLRSV
jgi:flagellar hook-associated protein 1 FlgK